MSFIEIERKFLLNSSVDNLLEYPWKNIKQGYIAFEAGNEVRIRAIGKDFFVTIKGKGSLIRTEVELPITQEQFDVLWPLSEKAQLSKNRYYIPWDNYTLEFDCYNGNLSPLKVVEVEFSSVEDSQQFSPPPFFGAEITNNPLYSNRILAQSQKAPSHE